jgi:hypothetical protein
MQNTPSPYLRKNRFPKEGVTVSVNKKLDTYKLVFDLMKHITTLSSGSILILIALLEKAFKATPPIGLVGCAFGMFSFSIVAAIMAMMILATNAADGALTDGERAAYAWSATFAATFFTIGILVVAWTAILAIA